MTKYFPGKADREISSKVISLESYFQGVMEISQEYLEIERNITLLWLCSLCTNAREVVTWSKQRLFYQNKKKKERFFYKPTKSCHTTRKHDMKKMQNCILGHIILDPLYNFLIFLILSNLLGSYTPVSVPCVG